MKDEGRMQERERRGGELRVEEERKLNEWKGRRRGIGSEG